MSSLVFLWTVFESENLHTEYDPNFDMELSFFEKEATFTQKVKLSEKGAKIKGELTFMVCDDSKCLPPEYVPFEFEVGDVSGLTNNQSEATTEQKPEKKSSDRSLIAIFFLSFLSGFAALLTPCVFPMIPMTVSFFTKQSKDKAKGIRNALFYGLSIIANG